LENIFHYKTVVLLLFSLFFTSADSETATCGRFSVFTWPSHEFSWWI